MKTVFEWIMSKNAVKVEFNSYLDSRLDQILEISMDIYSGSMTLSKFGDGYYMQHPITLKRTVPDLMFRSNDGRLEEDKIVKILDEMYDECFDILRRLRS